MTAVPPPPPGATPPMGAPQPSNAKAITSMILGIVSIPFCFYWFLAIPLGVVAIVLGVLANKDVAAGRGGSKGMALTGIITGAIGAVIGLVIPIAAMLGVTVFDGWIDQICADNPDNPACADR